MTVPTTTRILFFAANPAETNRLDLEEEVRDLQNELRAVAFRDSISLQVQVAVRPDDLVRCVREFGPTIVHFSGHGSKRGIFLRMDGDNFIEIPGDRLRRLFLDRGVKLLVLNACYTRHQCDAVASSVPAVIGTSAELNDEAARRFTVAFYRSLGNGLSVKEAFRDGGDSVELHGKVDVFWSHGDVEQILVG